VRVFIKDEHITDNIDEFKVNSYGICDISDNIDYFNFNNQGIYDSSDNIDYFNFNNQGIYDISASSDYLNVNCHNSNTKFTSSYLRNLFDKTKITLWTIHRLFPCFVLLYIMSMDFENK